MAALKGVNSIVRTLHRVPVKWLTGTVVLMATVWAATWSAQLFWALWPVQAAGVADYRSGAVLNSGLIAGSATGSQAVDMESLLAYDWFEGRTNRSGNVQPELTDAVETRLALQLRGAIPSSEPGAGMAIISAGERQSVVSVGEVVDLAPTGVRLSAVMMNRIVLDNNGRHETLWLDGPPSGSPAGTSSASKASGNDSAREGGPVGAFRYEDLGTPRVVREEGRFTGIAIGNDADADLLARHGLRAGDVVTAVDGERLTDMGRAMNAVQELRGMEEVQLGVLRDGETVTVSLRFE
ncbi:MAG: type II secretion system protein N [Pseudohongiellaceae bacterium]